MPFSRPTLQTLIERNQSDIEARLPSTDARLRRSNLEVIGRMHSAGLHSLYGLLDWLSRQALPDTAESEVLARWASIWNVTRKQASPAGGTIDMTGNNGSVIPAGTYLVRSDDVEFTTDDEATITGGTASAAVTAVVPGTSGNTQAGTGLSFVTPVSGVNNQVAVDGNGITGGTDIETDNSLRQRLLNVLHEPPHGGASFDYINWALEITEVTRVWVFSLEGGDGTVTVRFVVDDHPSSIIPDAAKVQEVQDYIDTVRPVTAVVTVAAPTPVTLDFDITVSPATTAVKDAVEAELADLIKREGEPGGTLLLSHINEAISLAAGETDHVLNDPVADVTHLTGEIPVMGTVTWS